MVNRQVATTSSWIFVGLFGLAFITFRPLARPLPKAEGNTTPAAGSTAKIDFQRDIQPIFVQSCYRCHGPAQQMSGLRLDLKQAALVGGQSGKVILPGKGSESTLYKRVAGIGDQARMPLGGKPLDPAQVQLIRTWIDEGAEWTATAEAKVSQPANHWAFIPPRLPAVPKVNNRTWVKTPIDAFVLARLEKEGLSPSPEADRTTLLRRLSLDLIGLPPTPEDVDAFLADKSKNAYEKQVDRLLKSVHYGEKWGRQWLDAARYADSNGFEKDMPRNVWFYRDWVINALNRDLPYNRFVLQQIAGDMLPGATQDQIVATGFLRNSMLNEQGGIAP